MTKNNTTYHDYSETVMQRLNRERSAAMAEAFEEGKTAGKKELRKSMEFWGFIGVSVTFLGLLFWMYMLFA